MDGTATGNPGRGGIDCEHSTCESLPVQTLYRSLQIPGILKFNKTETSGVTGNSIADDLRESYRVTLLFKPSL
jgi:hypothetical protein